MDKEKDFFKTCFNTVAGLEVKNESQAIAKEVVLSETENLQEENKKLKEFIDKAIDKLYCWGEVLDPIFQKEMLDILKEASE